MKHIHVDITGSGKFFVANTGQEEIDIQKYATFKEAKEELRYWKKGEMNDKP